MASPSTITAVTVAWSSGFVATMTPKQAQELFVNEMNKHRGRGKRKLSAYNGVEWSRPLQTWTYRIQYKKQIIDDNPTFATEELAAKGVRRAQNTSGRHEGCSAIPQLLSRHGCSHSSKEGACSMTVTLPWFAFYVDRFVKETSLLNPIEVAVYYRFLENYAQNGFLPNDIYILQEIVRLDSTLSVFRALTDTKTDREVWEAIKEATVNKLLNQSFTLGDDGNFHHAGWDKELQKSQKKHSDSVKRAALMNERLGRGAGAAEDIAGVEVAGGAPESAIK